MPLMRLSFKTRLAETQRRASDARTKAQSQARSSPEPPQAKLGPEGPRERSRAPEGAAHEQCPGKAGQLHAARARLRREKQSRKTALGNNGDLAQGAGEHNRAVRLGAILKQN